MGCDNPKEESEHQKRRRVLERARFWAWLAIFLGIAAFALLFFEKDMEARGVSPDVYWVGVIVLALLALVVLLIALSPIGVEECRRKERSYDLNDLTRLQHMSRGQMEERMRVRKFRLTEDGYYKKKKFSFLIDSVNYYVRLADGTEEAGGEDLADDIESVILREIQRYNESRERILAQKGNSVVYYGKRKKNCLILLVYDEVGAYEQEVIKALDKRKMLEETLNGSWILSSSQCNVREISAAVIAAVDKDTGEGYFLAAKRELMTIYDHGCKMLRRLSRPI
ncbi:MAG: hypothetical protein NC399_01670 [Muribaculum sp.]|nr:hypothetical protein [Muribaculum sp.]